MVMTCSERRAGGRSGLTNAYQHPRPNQNPKDLTCDFPYQTLPESMLAVRNPLVFLDWSTNAYHLPDLALHLPCITFTKHHRLAMRIGIICYENYMCGELM